MSQKVLVIGDEDFVERISQIASSLDVSLDSASDEVTGKTLPFSKTGNHFLRLPK
ncbi:MAG: hypothetical protein HZC17_05110 [Candidatus Omnitrophica bacterium]|nr:hypothetical protein [Candidatus Omnitrophota bacterium]